MDQKLILPIVMGVAILFVLYRRVRRNIGRQPLQPRRMQLRIGILGVVGAMMVFFAGRDMSLLGGVLAGLSGGLVLAWFALRHTKFESTAAGRFYTPHTYIGLAVSSLLLGRIAYRFVALYPSMSAASQSAQNPMATFQRSPMTLAIFGVLVGYYVFYYIGVLRKARDQPPVATEVVTSGQR